MAVKRKLFAGLRHMVPGDLEYWLEECNSEGLKLVHTGQTGMLYFSFVEDTPEKTRYVIDCPTMPKALYFSALVDDGWESLGQSMNCYIWRKTYTDGDRPADFSDKAGVRMHCFRQGLAFLLMFLAFLALFIAVAYAFYLRFKAGLSPVQIVEFAAILVFHIPFIVFFGIGSGKLLRESDRLKKSADASAEASRLIKIAEAKNKAEAEMAGFGKDNAE
ncbi:MAG: DUF2812 domain-containing protein [Lachnospiraceae bacterium]|nr:DUF2812 domain-containing protein [Lachnospiraceae bacterium]